MNDLFYTVDYDPELAIERAVEQWVLLWCQKYHPEAFEEAEKFLKGNAIPKSKR